MAASAGAGMLAPDGRCKALDAAADGYVRAEACIVLLLGFADEGRPPGALLAGTAVNQVRQAPAVPHCTLVFASGCLSEVFIEIVCKLHVSELHAHLVRLPVRELRKCRGVAGVKAKAALARRTGARAASRRPMARHSRTCSAAHWQPHAAPPPTWPLWSCTALAPRSATRSRSAPRARCWRARRACPRARGVQAAGCWCAQWHALCSAEGVGAGRGGAALQQQA
jgi:hypothetical protein